MMDRDTLLGLFMFGILLAAGGVWAIEGFGLALIVAGVGMLLASLAVMRVKS